MGHVTRRIDVVPLPYCPVLEQTFLPDLSFRIYFEEAPELRDDHFFYHCQLCGPITQGSFLGRTHACLLTLERGMYELWDGLICFPVIPG